MNIRTGEGAPVGRFRTSDGTSISYRVWGDRGDEPVVLHHGFASDADEDWVRSGVVAALVDSGFAVIGVDARGHGASDAPQDPAAYGAERFVGDLLELTTALDIGKFDLVGYSMGAVIAASLAATSPEVLHRLVLGGIGGSLVELGGVDTRVLPLSVLADAFRTDDLDEIVDPGLAGWRAAVDLAGWDRRALALVAESLDGPVVQVRDITVPTLLLAGDDDPLATAPQVVVEAMQDARLVTLPGDHTSARCSPAYSQSIVEFLTSSSAGPNHAEAHR